MPRSGVVAALTVVVLVGAGLTHPSRGATATNASRPDARIVAAQRAIGELGGIFPDRFGSGTCRIGYGGPVGGVMPGICTTRLGRLTKGPDYSGQSVIVLTERWRWPPPGKPGRRYGFGHTWLVRLGPSLKIFGVTQRGPIPPQLWR